MNNDRWRRLLIEERRRVEQALGGYREKLAAATDLEARDEAEGHIAQLEERLAAVAQAQERLAAEGDRHEG